jgi:hypothetical protein
VHVAKTRDAGFAACRFVVPVELCGAKQTQESEPTGNPQEVDGGVRKGERTKLAHHRGHLSRRELSLLLLARRVHVVHVVQERIETRIDALFYIQRRTTTRRERRLVNRKKQNGGATGEGYSTTHPHVVRTRVVGSSLEAILPPLVAPRVAHMRRGVCRETNEGADVPRHS